MGKSLFLVKVNEYNEFITNVNSPDVIFEIIAPTFRISFLENLSIAVSCFTESPLIL